MASGSFVRGAAQRDELVIQRDLDRPEDPEFQTRRGSLVKRRRGRTARGCQRDTDVWSATTR